MRKAKKYNICDTNLANFGSDLEKNIKYALFFPLVPFLSFLFLIDGQRPTPRRPGRVPGRLPECWCGG
jgi:hypothetical protein